MKMVGEHLVEASLERVWAGLNDPDVLRECIPGCETLVRVSDTEFTATATLKIGPAKMRFGGAVHLSDLDPPHSYKITGEAQGGASGFAKGGAVVTLEPAPQGTLLRYESDAQIGGKLAQMGARLIDATSRKMADEFFRSFAEHMTKESAPAAPLAAASSGPDGGAAASIGARANRTIWLLGAALAALGILAVVLYR